MSRGREVRRSPELLEVGKVAPRHPESRPRLLMTLFRESGRLIAIPRARKPCSTPGPALLQLRAGEGRAIHLTNDVKVDGGPRACLPEVTHGIKDHSQNLNSGLLTPKCSSFFPLLFWEGLRSRGNKL